MKQTVIEILDQHRVMTVATLRPDGWPQATMVGYANEDLLLFFLISRSSQKYANLVRDNRVSLAIGDDVEKISDIRALSMSALVYPVRDEALRAHGYGLLVKRRPELKTLPEPDWRDAAIVRAVPRDIAVLDFTQGLGHSDLVRVGYKNTVTMEPVRPEDWGPTPRAQGGGGA